MSQAGYYTAAQQQQLIQQQAQQQALMMEQQRQQQFMQQYQQQYSPQQIESMMANPAATAASYDASVHLTTSDFDQHTDRTLYVKLEGSLSDFARGTLKPTWHADEGCEHIYMRIAGMENGRPVFEGETDKGLILGMHLETLASTFPVDIGAVITGVQGKEVVASGQSYAFIARSHCAEEPKKCIFEARDRVTRAALEKYNDTSAAKMESHVFRSQAGFTLVDNMSPLAGMMRCNSAALKMTFGLREGEAGFLKVATPIVDACLARYDEDQQVNFVDMKKFRIDFERVDSPTDWARPEGVIDNLRNAGKGQNGHASSARLTNTYRLIAKVNAKLVLYGGPAPAAAATAHA